MKSNTAIHVTLWDNQVGTLFWFEKESLSYFEFAPLFLGKNLDITPLDFLLYLGKRGMGALEYEPAFELNTNDTDYINVVELLMS
ncbi:MAG: hypothetical protein K5920_04195 [Bacteroidales bacterium]|nr:hypothetical protein [Bacteroidales bacterium]